MKRESLEFPNENSSADKIWSAVAKNIWRETGGFTDHADTGTGIRNRTLARKINHRRADGMLV